VRANCTINRVRSWRYYLYAHMTWIFLIEDKDEDRKES